MGESIENGAALQELPDESQFQEKGRKKILLLEIEKKESKNFTFIQNPQCHQSKAEPKHDMGKVYEQEMFTRKLSKTQEYLGTEVRNS